MDVLAAQAAVAQPALVPAPVTQAAEHKEVVVDAALPPPVVGSKLDVWKGKASKTRGGLEKKDLRLNRVGTVVSIKASDAAKRHNNLGKFLFQLNQKKPCPDE
jgi:hypothetical protein